MMTALYVFIGVLAAALVIYIFVQFAGFVRKIKRKLDENNATNRVSYASPRTSYYGYYGMFGPNSEELRINNQRLLSIQDKLDDLENKIDQLLEEEIGGTHIVIAKKRSEE